jgi:ribosomal protein L37AE/L43A
MQSQKPTCEQCGRALVLRRQTIYKCSTCGAVSSGGTSTLLACQNAGHKLTSYVSENWQCRNPDCALYVEPPEPDKDDIW